MKNLKKVLSLVLVVVMAFSLVTIASAAKLDDYSDAANITQKEAVDVLSQAGVLQGAGGAFSPTDTFTREQAAKVITYLMLGTKVADNLRTTKSSFTDVAATRWSAPYIEYGVSTGVINGMGDGTFNPEGKVTGTQFAKMILTALGYGKNGEYVGPSWEINTLRDAVALEILDLDVDYTAPATREQVAQYALNALTESAVVWTKDTDQYIAKSGGANYFANKLDLVRTATTVSGVSGFKWTLDGNEIGFYPDEKLIASDATGLKISQMTDKYGMWSMFFKAELETGAQYFYNGNPTAIPTLADGTTYATGNMVVYLGDVYTIIAGGNGQTGAAIAANILASLAPGAPASTMATSTIKPGVVVNFMNTDKDAKAETVSIIEKTVAQVTGAPSVSFGNVKVPGITFNGSPTVNEAKIKYPAGIEADDYVLYYQDIQTGVWHLEKAQVVTGVATNSYVQNGATFYNIGGVGRRDSGLTNAIGAAGLASFMATGFNVELKVVIDNGGNIIDVEADDTAITTANYAVLLDAIPASVGFSTGVDAMMLFTDGITKNVKISKVDNVTATSTAGNAGNADALQGKFVTFTINSDGTYNIKTPAYSYTVGTADINRAANFTTSHVGDSTTIFLYKKNRLAVPGDSDYYTYSVATGIANAPDTNGATGQGIEVLKFSPTGNAKIVFVENYSAPLLSGTVENVAYIIYDGIFVNYTIWPAKDNEPQYYEYKAIVDGEATTVKALDMFKVGGNLASGLFKVTYDEEGYVTAATANPAVAATGSTTHIGNLKPSNGIIKIGGTGYTYNGNTKVFYIDAFGTVTKATVADMNRDTDDIVTVHLTQSTLDAPDLLEAIYITVK